MRRRGAFWSAIGTIVPMDKIVHAPKVSAYLGLGIFLLIIFLPGYTKLQELRDKNRDLTMKGQRLKAENVLLEKELQRLGSDKFYQEKILREKMDVVRKDEVLVKVVPEKE